MTERYAKVFDLRSCRDLLGKLERELLRLEYSLDRFDRADHAANFAIWAWRLTDWVYAEILGRTALLTRLASACGLPVETLDLEAFRRHIESPQACPGLASCRAIATAAQRVNLGSGGAAMAGSSAAGNVFSLDPSAHGLQSLVELTEWQAPNWILKCGEDHARVPDIELFAEVLEFWTDYIHQNHIA